MNIVTARNLVGRVRVTLVDRQSIYEDCEVRCVDSKDQTITVWPLNVITGEIRGEVDHWVQILIAGLALVDEGIDNALDVARGSYS